MTGIRPLAVAATTAALLAAAACSKPEPPTAPAAPPPAAAAAEPTPSAGTSTPGAQGLLVKPVAGATHGTYSVWDATGEKRLKEHAPADEVVPFPPGRYRLVDQTSYLPYAKEAEVKPGATTTILLGALRLLPVEGAANAVYSIYDGTGEKRFREHNEPGAAVSAGPGKYRLSDQTSYMPFAKDVEVKAGEVAEVRIGAMRLVPVEGAANAVYSIYDATGEKRFREHNEPGAAVSAGPGKYRLFDQASYAPFAKDVDVKAGETTEVRIGAMRLVPVEGAAHAVYSLYDATGEKRLREHNEPDRVLSAGPGKYRLFDQASYAPYAKDVEVRAGETTEVAIGALKVVAVEGADHGVYSTYDATGEKRLREHGEPGRVVSAGPGKYTLFDQSSYTPYARDVEVKAGATTVVALGAIRGPGAAWSLYDATGQKRFRENVEAGAVISAGPGKYRVRDQGSGKEVGGAEVVAGAIAEVK